MRVFIKMKHCSTFAQLYRVYIFDQLDIGCIILDERRLHQGEACHAYCKRNIFKCGGGGERMEPVQPDYSFSSNMEPCRMHFSDNNQN